MQLWDSKAGDAGRDGSSEEIPAIPRSPEFTLRTDNSALGWLKRWSLHEGGMIARWILHLNSFSMKFEHRPRAHHKNADGLTRMQHHLDKPGFSPSDPARMPGFKFLMNNQVSTMNCRATG